tara:strand:- start:2866 stop:3507 length:642 start_codon:yes stop_codon:yes gene_type:complete
MATRPGIDSSITARLAADHQNIFFAVKAEFDTSDVLVWNGAEDLVISSETYAGAGQLLSVGAVEDDAELKSAGLSVSISGMDTTVLDYALTENYQNRFVSLFMGFLMGGANEAAGVMTLFKGRMVNLSVVDTTDGATISINAENRLLDLRRPSNLRYTKNAQTSIDSTDTGFNRINTLQDKTFVWGRSSSGGGSAGKVLDETTHRYYDFRSDR